MTTGKRANMIDYIDAFIEKIKRDFNNEEIEYFCTELLGCADSLYDVADEALKKSNILFKYLTTDINSAHLVLDSDLAKGGLIYDYKTDKVVKWNGAFKE